MGHFLLLTFRKWKIDYREISAQIEKKRNDHSLCSFDILFVCSFSMSATHDQAMQKQQTW